MKSVRYSTKDGREITPRTVEDAVEAQPTLGARLRLLRHQAGYSLMDVAEGANISASFLSLVETGKRDITISRLMRLANFYQTKVIDLLPQPRSAGAIVVRRGEERHIRLPEEKIDIFFLTSHTRRTMMPIMEVFEEGGRTVEALVHEGEEFAHVLEGRIIVEIEGVEPLVLQAGDSVYFSADRPHSYGNDAEGQARMLLVVTPPSL